MGTFEEILRNIEVRGVRSREFFIKRFKRKPERDPGYYRDWLRRFQRGYPELYMDKKSYRVFRGMQIGRWKKRSKAIAKYMPKAKKNLCKNCSYYSMHEDNKCYLVAGRINQKGTCLYWEKK
jgi:hypothetical protein